MINISTIKVFAVMAVIGLQNTTVTAQSGPTNKASSPTTPSEDVISLFSNSYANVGVDTWRTPWSSGNLTDTTVDGSDIKKYSELTFVGIETTGGNLIDASNMVYFNIDIWTPNATQLRIKLVDFGPDRNFGGGDDSEHELSFNAIPTGDWIRYKIPMSDFVNMTSSNQIAQLILAAQPDGAAIIYIDNVYYSKDAPIATPQSPAPTPGLSSEHIISLFCDAYTNQTVNTFRTDWSSSAFEEIIIDGNKTLKYSNLDFVGIETVGDNTIDASDMQYVHFDAWTPNATLFRFKIVDFGPDGNFGGGDDSEQEIVFENPNKEEWINVKLAFSDMPGLNNRTNIAQYIFSAQPVGLTTLYVDNLFFSRDAETSVSRVKSLNGHVYPNPTNQLLNIQLTSRVNITTYSLMSMDGRILLSNNNDHSILHTTMDLSNVPQGVYMLQVATEDGQYSYKIVKQ